MEELRVKREKLHEMIGNIHEEAEEKKNQYLSLCQNLVESRGFLLKSLEVVEGENESYLQILRGKEDILRLDGEAMSDNNKVIKEKEKV